MKLSVKVLRQKKKKQIEWAQKEHDLTKKQVPDEDASNMEPSEIALLNSTYYLSGYIQAKEEDLALLDEQEKELENWTPPNKEPLTDQTILLLKEFLDKP